MTPYWKASSLLRSPPALYLGCSLASTLPFAFQMGLANRRYSQKLEGERSERPGYSFPWFPLKPKPSCRQEGALGSPLLYFPSFLLTVLETALVLSSLQSISFEHAIFSLLRPTDTHPLNIFHIHVPILLLFNVEPSPHEGDVPHHLSHPSCIDYDLPVPVSLHWSEDLRTLVNAIQVQNPLRVLQVVF